MFLISLQVDISPNILVTERKANNTIFTVTSGILGSVAGLLAVFGSAVKFSEDNMNKFKKKIKQK